MWEDMFTGVFKFRARWLLQASDLPADALTRLRTTGHTPSADCSAAGSMTPSNKGQHEDDEVFLTRRVKDLEVRFIVKAITLCVSTSSTPDVFPESKGKMGPRLTHAFCDASGDLQPLEGTDPILKRARVRLANGVNLTSRADQENEAAKSGKPIVKSNGWLLPKQGLFERAGGSTAARGAGGGVEVMTSPSSGTGSRSGSSSPSMDIEEEASDDSEAEEPPNSEDGEWKNGEEGGDGDVTDTDFDSHRKTSTTLSVGEGSAQRKSTRQRKSQRSPTPDAEVSPTPDAEVEGSSEAKPQTKVCPLPCTTAAAFQRRLCLPLKKRQVLMPPRPRRLAMPPMAEDILIAHVCEPPPLANAMSSVPVKVARPVKTRMSLGLRPKPFLAFPRSASMEGVGKASQQFSVSAKRKRTDANKSTPPENRSDYPPLRTLVGKDHQTDIPDLLSAGERNQPRTRNGAKMVWRSVQDWDSQSRGMLTSYLHAAKGVVEWKQARPGVAVHVRLGGKKACGGADKVDSTEIASSYAVWAISSGPEAGGLIRVACSEMAQTDIPRSAIQRVQSQEQALAALVKARCVLDNVEPALQMLAHDHLSPESIEPWTLKQVRTLEKALVKEYDPSRRLHGWARSGLEMDREDFIDLAKVSEEVPGKTPAQVLSFYYRYLAAAEPLTDVVYGPEAAKARRQEPIFPGSSDPDAVVLPGNDRMTRGNANTTRPKTPARQASPGLSKVSAANSLSKPSEPAPKPKPRVIRLSAPKPVESFFANTEPNHGPGFDSVRNTDGSTKRNPSPRVGGAFYSAPEATSTSHSPAVSKRAVHKIASKRATHKVAFGGDDLHADADRGKGREPAAAAPSDADLTLPRPSGVLSMTPRSVPRNSDIMEGQRKGGSDGARDDIFGSMAPCWRLLERAQAYMDKDQLGYMRGLTLTHARKPMSREQVNHRLFRSLCRGNVRRASYKSPLLYVFCTAHHFVEYQVYQTSKPNFSRPHPSRRARDRHQLLERAESCLQEQDNVLAGFVKMFDRIDQPPQVPLYPA
ncbi:unnamed protein product, partial [Laminaria digitata]